MKLQILLLLTFLLHLVPLDRAVADDWPSWRGPYRDGICREKGLLQTWPSGGPKLLWKKSGIGDGYSGPAVVGDMLYIMGDGNGKEWVVALDVSRGGRQVWASATGPITYRGSYPGPRCTPTVDGDRLYVLGAAGKLACMNVHNGQIHWMKDLVADFGGSVPQWGYAESVLIDGKVLLCTPGGRRATIAALDKTTGRTVWTSPVGDPAGYSSIIKVSLGKVPQYVTLTGRGVIGVAARDGTPLWRYDAPSNGTANIPTCIWWGQTIFGATGYGTGGGLAWIKKTPQGFSPQQIYFTKDMENHHGGMILLDGFLYGSDNPGILNCLDYKTGKRLWADRRPGKCSILYADGRLYCRDEKGPLSLVEATPRGFQLRGRFDQPDRSSKNAWPHLVVAHGGLYVRDQGVLLCYDVRQR